MSIEENLKKNNIQLPKAADPVGSYVATKISGKFLYISGQISMDANGNLIKGKIGRDLDAKKGYEAAERCALSIISQAKKIFKEVKVFKPLSSRKDSKENFIICKKLR